MGGIMHRERYRVCPVELANSLDSKIRRWLQNPQRILSPFIKEGMQVLDIGCGPGFFSIEMARMVGDKGTVFSADLQEGMLQKIRKRIEGTALERRIVLVKSEQEKTNVKGKMDFILAFYMVHEVPDKDSLFSELRNILKDDGQFLLVEPKLFHVSRKDFASTMEMAKSKGFTLHAGPRLPFSWSALLTTM